MELTSAEQQWRNAVKIMPLGCIINTTMKNLFKREDHTDLIIGITVGMTTGIGRLAFLTEKGAPCLKQISKRFNGGINSTAAEVIEKHMIIPKKAAQ